jgi:large repetitive protein
MSRFIRLNLLLMLTATLLCFNVYAAAPVINSFSPASGPIGTKVTINGQNFNTTTTGNIVYFGATAGKVISATATKLVVEVMPGASYEPISLLNKQTRLTGYSKIPFRITFPSKNSIQPDDFTSIMCQLNHS